MIFALPGNIDSPVSRGTHQLIKEGAKLVDSLEDILIELNINFQNTPKAAAFKLSSYEENIDFTKPGVGVVAIVPLNKVIKSKNELE